MGSLETIGQVFQEKGISGKCELCGGMEWSINTNLDHLAFLKKSPDSDAVESINPLPVVVFICDKCGNMRMFAKHVLGVE